MFIVFLAATLLAAAFLLHCAVVGRAVLRGLLGRGGGLRDHHDGPDGPLTLFFSICLGMLVNMAGLFLLGMAGYLRPAGVAGMALALLAVSLAAVRGEYRSGGRPGLGGSGGPEAAMLAVLFLLAVAVALHPPGHWDDTMYQLPLARDYVQQQAIVLNEYLRFPLFPQNFNLLFAVGLMLGDALQAPTGPGAADIAGLVHIAPAASTMAGDTAGVMSGAVAGAAAAAAAAGLWHFGAPEVFAQMFASLPLFVMALGLWAAARRYMGSGIPGLLAGLTLFMIGPVKSTLGFAYIDNGLALFCWAATLATALIAERPSVAGMPAALRDRYAVSGTTAGLPARSWAFPALAGLLAGAACGTKYFGVVLAALIGVVIIVLVMLQERRKAAPGQAGHTDVRPVASPSAAVSSPSVSPAPASVRPTPAPYAAALRAAAVYAAAVLLAGSWWYVRSTVISGDPAHPAGARLFGFFLWNEGDLAGQHAEQAMHGVRRNPMMLPYSFLEAGVLLWLPAFAGLFLRRLPNAIRVLQAIFLAYMLFWFFVTQVPRYLAPVYGVGGFLAFHALHRLYIWGGQRWPRMRRGPVWPASLALILIAAYTADRAIKYGREFIHAETVLATSSGYPLYQQANAHIGTYGSRLVQVGFENGIYFFQGTVIGDWFGPGRYRDLLGCPELPCAAPPPAQLESMLRAHGARMLLVSRRHVDLPADFEASLSPGIAPHSSGNRPLPDARPSPYSGRLRLLAQNGDGALLGVDVDPASASPVFKD